LRWQDCDFENDSFQIEHSYYWRRGGILKSTKTEASAKPLPMDPARKLALLEWRTQSTARNLRISCTRLGSTVVEKLSIWLRS
jgi:hypothetical protein